MDFFLAWLFRCYNSLPKEYVYRAMLPWLTRVYLSIHTNCPSSPQTFLVLILRVPSRGTSQPEASLKNSRWESCLIIFQSLRRCLKSYHFIGVVDSIYMLNKVKLSFPLLWASVDLDVLVLFSVCICVYMCRCVQAGIHNCVTAWGGRRSTWVPSSVVLCLVVFHTVEGGKCHCVSYFGWLAGPRDPSAYLALRLQGCAKRLAFSSKVLPPQIPHPPTVVPPLEEQM